MKRWPAGRLASMTGHANEVPRLRVHQDPGLPRGRLPGRPLPEVRAAVARYVPDEELEPEQEEKTNEMPQVQATHFQI